MERQRRQRDISLSIHSFSLTAGPSGSYGLKLSGKAPAMVALVQKGSPAARAGLQVGDFILRLAGEETRSADGEKILRRLKEEVGKTVEVGVARPSPVPVTDKEKMKALIVLQTKLDSGTIFQPSGPGYSDAVQDALSSTRDILGDLGLDPAPLPATQEVEVKMYDSDSLPSPPPSSESEEEKDPLLDFSKDDALTYRPGQPAKPVQSLADSVRQATQALESIKDLTEGLKKKERRKSPEQVSSVASLQMTGVSSTRREKTDITTETQALDEGLREQSPSPFEEGKEDLQWVEPGAAPPPPLPPHSKATFSQERGEGGNPPPVPPHGRTREQRGEEERKKREREDTRREIERELARREKDDEKIREQKADVVPSRGAPTVAASKGGVTLRMKQSRDRPAGVEEEEGRVIGKPMGYKKLHPPPSHPAPSPPADEPVRDMTAQQTALHGLPPSIVTWRGEEVATWLFQLSPTLSQHYRPCFSRHYITGQTLMRLNLAKLKSMGIDNIKHCQQLGLEIAKLKIYQESLELRELEEETQLSFL